MRLKHRHAIGWWLWVVFVQMAAITLSADPVISEFLAVNGSGLADEDGDHPDWIEIFNPSGNSIALAGYHLTDDANALNKWTFPAVSLAPGGYLVVFASGKDRREPKGPLHTSFELAGEGDYLALVAPDGRTVVSEFAPGYPTQFENESFGLGGTTLAPAYSYFTTPTPGAPNGSGRAAGPAIEPIERNPPAPQGGPLTITARVRAVNQPVTAVRLSYRRMFVPEVALPMTDDGTGPDAQAGDGVWTATIPADAFAPGEMTRWRFAATDRAGTETKEPPFRAPLDSPQYFGTVTVDTRIQSRLPVLHWFTSNPTGAGTAGGSRGAVFYEGEFYDNVLFTLHGQSTSGFPKKSYNLDFNRPQRFRWSTNAPRVADIDLLTNWADKSKVRHVLAYEVMRESGVAAHFAFTVRVQQNGRFFSTADLVEDADEIYLERAGLNKEGALYKVYSNQLNKDGGNTATAGVEKKTRRGEDNADLQALIDGLDLTGQPLVNYLYDHIDLPACINMLAVNSVIRNTDMHSKNWYLYRDTGRSGEWAILPWDLDLSHGRLWNTQNTYFDNALYTNGFVVNSTSIRLVSQLFGNPATRAMILRRIRTLSDRFLQPVPAPGTSESALYYERRLNEQAALIDPPEIIPSDARQDFEKWGSWLQGGTTVRSTNSEAAVETMAEAVQRWKAEYLPGRRRFIYNTQIVGRGGEIPLPQTSSGPVTNYTALVARGAAAKVLVPANGGLGATWTGAPAFEPFDTAGWLDGNTGVGYERGTGYEALLRTNVDAPMRNNSSVYLRVAFNVADPSAFDRLELRMQSDDGFVAFLNGAFLASALAPSPLQWNSAATGSHEANVGTQDVYAVTDKLASLRPGLNILAIQGLNQGVESSDMLVLPELVAGITATPASGEPRIRFGSIEFNPASGNQDEEFIQLLNPNAMAVDLSGWRLAGGVDHLFAPGTVLPAGGALYVCPSAATFRARTASPKGGEGLFVQGGCKRHLSNLGEVLAIIDQNGTTNNLTTYQANPSDAQRYLVVSELMVHPAGDGLAEFIELLNASASITLDLANVRFTRGVEFDFTGSAITALPPGGRVLVVRDLAAFQAVYGTNLPVAGAFANGTALNNSGEEIKLEDARNGTIQQFTYDKAAPWPAVAPGFSLVLVAPESNPDPNLAANWRSGTRHGGSPGLPESTTSPADPLGDRDGNGERDLIDYVLGNDLGWPPILPKLAVRSGPAGGSPTLEFSFPILLDVPNATVAVFCSTDLIQWQDGTPHLELVSRELLGGSRALMTWRLRPSLDGQPRVFLRLRAVTN